MPTYQQTPREQFADLIPTFRNSHIIAGMQPLILLHQQIHSNGGLADRSGSDTAFRNLVLMHIYRADAIRRKITFNPENEQLAALTIPEVEAALKAELEKAADIGVTSQENKPFGGDAVTVATTQVVNLRWKFDGSDPTHTIRLESELDPRFLSGPGYLLFGAVNEAIVAWTNLESRFRPQFVSKFDSTRILGKYQQIVNSAMSFMGEANRVDVPEGVLASERPSGPQSAPNVVNESNPDQPIQAPAQAQ